MGCSTCGGDGKIHLLGANYTDCPDCDGSQSFDVYEWEAAIWFAQSNVQITLVGTENNPTVPFGPRHGIVIHPQEEEWVASTTHGNQKGECTDPQKLANQLIDTDQFLFRDQNSQKC